MNRYVETFKGNIESTTLSSKKSYEYFGEESFFTLLNRKFGAMAKEKSIIYYITRE